MIWDLVTSFHASPRHLIYLSSQENPAAVPKSVLSFPNTLHPQGEIGREVEKCCFVSRASQILLVNSQILLVRFSKIQHFPGYMIYMPHSSHIFPGDITFSASNVGGMPVFGWLPPRHALKPQRRLVIGRKQSGLPVTSPKVWGSKKSGRPMWVCLKMLG